MESLKCVYDPFLMQKKSQGNAPIYKHENPALVTSDPRSSDIFNSLPKVGKRSFGHKLEDVNIFIYKRLKRVLVKNIPSSSSSFELKTLFQNAGNVLDCEVKRVGYKGNIMLGYAVFENEKTCQSVCMNTLKLFDDNVVFKYSPDWKKIVVIPDDDVGSKFQRTIETIKTQTEEKENALGSFETRYLNEESLEKWYNLYVGTFSTYIFWILSVNKDSINFVRKTLSELYLQPKSICGNQLGFFLIFESPNDAKQAFFRLRSREPELELIINGQLCNPFELHHETKEVLVSEALENMRGVIDSNLKNMVSATIKKIMSEEASLSEKLKAEKLEAQRLEAERLEVERLENERLEAERLENERLEAARLENERLEAERLENERLEAERLQKIKIKTEENERAKLEAISSSKFQEMQEIESKMEVESSTSAEEFSLNMDVEPQKIEIKNEGFNQHKAVSPKLLKFYTSHLPKKQAFGNVLNEMIDSPDKKVLARVLDRMCNGICNSLPRLEKLVSNWPPTATQYTPYVMTPFSQIPFSDEWKSYISTKKTKNLYDMVQNYESMPILTKKYKPRVISKLVTHRKKRIHRRKTFKFNEIGPDVSLSELAKPTRIARSRIHDWGLYASEPINENEFIMEYVGELINDDMADSRERKYILTGIHSTYMFRLDDGGTVVDATFTGNIARFMNHSCNPNCKARFYRTKKQTHIVFFSLRAIAQNEELTFSYNLTEATENEERIRCCCGSVNCTGWLT